MKTLKLTRMFLALLLIKIFAVSAFAQEVADVTIQDLRIAVIYNPHTTTMNAPYGVSVGGVSDQPLRGGWGSTDNRNMAWVETSTLAPEIAEAQLRFLLSAIDPNNVDIRGSLDARSVSHVGQGHLENVRVWRTDDLPNFEQLMQSFANNDYPAGQVPNVIVYIGAGAELPVAHRGAFFDLFDEAAEADVGVFFLGHNSVLDARELDPTRENFPIQGVQQNFRFSAFGYQQPSGLPDGHEGMVVSEFNFFNETNRDDAMGNFWLVADTLVFSGNDGNYQIHRVENGQRTTRVYHNGWTLPAGLTLVSPEPQIIHSAGTWSIYAQAVEVIGIDNYDAQMNVGLHTERAIHVGLLISSGTEAPGAPYFGGGAGGVGQVFIKAESHPLVINGQVVFTPVAGNINQPAANSGFNLSTAHTTHSALVPQALQMNGNIVAQDWFINAPNPETGSTDRVLVLRRGQYIENIRHTSADAWHNNVASPNGTGPNEGGWFQYTAGSRINFNAGGLRDLRIVLNAPNSEIHQSIFTFPTITPETPGVRVVGTGANQTIELAFRPYGNSAMGWHAHDNNHFGGRIQAGASIWDFNQFVNNRTGPRDFSDLLGAGGQFIPNTHYANNLAVQMAGRPSGQGFAFGSGSAIRAQFNRPQTFDGEFNATTMFLLESELPATVSRQLDPSDLPANNWWDNTNRTHSPYFDEFQNKVFNQISVVQFNRRRLAIVGYQPTFLVNHEISRAIIEGIIMWAGFDQYSVTAPALIRIDENNVEQRNPVDGMFISTNERGFIAEFDFNWLSPLAREERWGTHRFYAEMSYAGQTSPRFGPWNITPGVVRENFGIYPFTINPANHNDDHIMVRVWSAPQSPFAGDTNTIRLNFRPQEVRTAQWEGATITASDVIDVSVVTHDPSERVITPDSVYWRIYSRYVGGILNEVDLLTEGVLLPNPDGSWSISLADVRAGEVFVSMRSVKDGYLNSPLLVRRFVNEPDNCPPYLRDGGIRWNIGEFNQEGAQAPTILQVIINDDGNGGFEITSDDPLDLLRLFRGSAEYIVRVRRTSCPHSSVVPPLSGAECFELIGVFQNGNPVPDFVPNEETDRVNLNVGDNPGVRDRFGNYITDEVIEGCQNNPLRTINIRWPQRRIMGVVVFPVLQSDDLSGGIFGLSPENAIVRDIIGNESGTMIIAVPNFDLNHNDLERINVSIFDATGNMVASTAETNQSQIGTTIATINRIDVPVDDTSEIVENRRSLVIAWNNRNYSGREVGAGAYLLVFESRWRDPNQTISRRELIPVRIGTGEPLPAANTRGGRGRR